MEENFLFEIIFSSKLVYSCSLLLEPTAVLVAQAQLTVCWGKKRDGNILQKFSTLYTDSTE